MFTSSERFDAYCYRERLGFKDSTDGVIITEFDMLVSGRIYVADGRWIDAQRGRLTTQQADAAILERLTALAVQCSVGDNVTIDSNVMFVPHGANHEYESTVVHDCNASTAYIVESARSPLPGDVAKLLERVEAFKLWAAVSYRYDAVTKFVPVLGGRHFSDDTISECIAHNVSRVVSAGADLEWIRDKRKSQFPQI